MTGPERGPPRRLLLPNTPRGPLPSSLLPLSTKMPTNPTHCILQGGRIQFQFCPSLCPAVCWWMFKHQLVGVGLLIYSIWTISWWKYSHHGHLQLSAGLTEHGELGRDVIRDSVSTSTDTTFRDMKQGQRGLSSGLAKPKIFLSSPFTEEVWRP